MNFCKKERKDFAEAGTSACPDIQNRAGLGPWSGFSALSARFMAASLPLKTRLASIISRTLPALAVGASTLLANTPAEAQTEALVYAPNIETVTLYPNQARLEIKEKAAPQRLDSGETVLTVYLPGTARPDTLSAQIDGQLIGSNIKRLEAGDSADPILAPWRAALQNATAERDRLKAEIEAVEARISLWQLEVTPTANIASELNNLDQAVQKGLKAANDRLLELAPLLEEAEKKVALAEQNLKRLSPSYKVEFVLARLRSGSEFTYSYMLGKCSWYPAYTLDAMPDNGKVNLIFSAKLQQLSGFDWKDTRLQLATNAVEMNPVPEALDNWAIGPMPPSREKSAPMMAGMASESAMARAVAMEEEDNEVEDFNAEFSAPKEISFSTYAIWDMGKRTLPNAKPAMMAIAEESLNARFYYTVRPKVDDFAYLTAELVSDQENGASARIYPQSEATFLVEGNMAGTGEYPPKASDNLFFGSSPLLKVSCTELENITDEKGLLGKSKIHNWHWKFTVENKSGKPVDLRIEDRMPRIWDARIELKQNSVPAPQMDEKKQLYFWETPLAAGESYEIDHKIEATAPSDVGLNSTR